MTERTPSAPVEPNPTHTSPDEKTAAKRAKERRHKWYKGMAALGTAALAFSFYEGTIDPTYNGDIPIEACEGVDTEAIAAATSNTLLPARGDIVDIGDLSGLQYANNRLDSYQTAVDDSVPINSVARIVDQDDNFVGNGLAVVNNSGHSTVVTTGDYSGHTAREFQMSFVRHPNKKITASWGCVLEDPNDPNRSVTVFTFRKRLGDTDAYIKDESAGGAQLAKPSDIASNSEPLLGAWYADGYRPEIPQAGAAFPLFFQPESGNATVFSGVTREAQYDTETEAISNNSVIYIIHDNGTSSAVGLTTGASESIASPDQLANANVVANQGQINEQDIRVTSVIGPDMIDRAVNSSSVNEEYAIKPAVDYLDLVPRQVWAGLGVALVPLYKVMKWRREVKRAQSGAGWY